MTDPGTDVGGPDPRSAPLRRVLLSLGSNLGDRIGHLRTAVTALGDEVVATSDVFETAPVGGPDQEPFLNMVVALRTAVGAQALLVRGQALEADAARERTVRWGPRTLDVDILWIDGERHAEPGLQVPHPRMAERAFVMVPLADVAPDLVPDGWSAPDQEIRRVGPLGAVL